VLSSLADLIRDARVRQGRQRRLRLPTRGFKARYATFGLSDGANPDEGDLWPTDFALKRLTAAAEARIGAIVRKPVS
jgi:hypothetical protein